MNNDIFREKLKNGGFTEEELQLLSFGDIEADIEIIEEQEGNNHRWQREMTTIFKFEDKFYALDWMQGLTECQENDYYKQPYEVEKKEKTIVVNEWSKVNE